MISNFDFHKAVAIAENIKDSAAVTEARFGVSFGI